MPEPSQASSLLCLGTTGWSLNGKPDPCPVPPILVGRRLRHHYKSLNNQAFTVPLTILPRFVEALWGMMYSFLRLFRASFVFYFVRHAMLRWREWTALNLDRFRIGLLLDSSIPSCLDNEKCRFLFICTSVWSCDEGLRIPWFCSVDILLKLGQWSSGTISYIFFFEWLVSSIIPRVALERGLFDDSPKCGSISSWHESVLLAQNAVRTIINRFNFCFQR